MKNGETEKGINYAMKNTILIITSSFDATVDYIVSKYSSIYSFFRFDIDRIESYSVSIVADYFKIVHQGAIIDSTDIISIYYRKPTLPDLSMYGEFSTVAAKHIISVIEGLVESFAGICLSKPSKLRITENKAYQLLTASKAGFLLPESLMTNDKENAQEFCGDKECIIKPISGAKLHTNSSVLIMQTNLINNCNFESIEYCPAYIQKYIKKDYELRITILDTFIYAARIDSKDSVDWRSHNNEVKYSVAVLPDSVREKCQCLMNEYGIKFGAIDMIVYRGNYYFLEVNPNGQWLWLEKELGWDLSEKIVKYLGGAYVSDT